MKYVDADRLRAELTDRLDLFKELSSDTISPIRIDECSKIIDIIDSLQQDETQVDKMLCSQVWWEEQGWIMIPPDATIEGIDSLLKQVRKKLQQEHSDIDLEKFTQKMNDWKARYNYPDSISVKATMAFTARMFYMYPDIAREWYEQLPKATQD